MAERNVVACAKLDGKVQDALSWTNVEDPVLLVHVADTVLVTTMKPHPLPFVNVSRAIGLDLCVKLTHHINVHKTT